MENITSSAELKNAIQRLEVEQAENGKLLKEQFFITYEGLKPVSIVKSILKEIVSPPNFTDNLLNTAMSMASGYLSKKMAVGDSDNKFRQFLGAVLQFGVTNLVSQNANSIESIGKYLFQNFLHKKK